MKETAGVPSEYRMLVRAPQQREYEYVEVRGQARPGAGRELAGTHAQILPNNK
jgi:hypothetical protein